jgi:hypothetical protein
LQNLMYRCCHGYGGMHYGLRTCGSAGFTSRSLREAIASLNFIFAIATRL